MAVAAYAGNAATCINFEPATGGSPVCDAGPIFSLSGGFSWTDHSFSASLFNWVQFSISGDNPFVDVHGFQQAGADGYFVVTGGTGAGTMIGSGFGEVSCLGNNAGAFERFDSNFIPQYLLFDSTPLSFDFIYNVPFQLHLYDRIDYFTIDRSRNSVGLNDLTAIYDVTFDTFLDCEGKVVSNAVFQATPEPSTWMLFGLGLGALIAWKLKGRGRSRVA